LFSSAPSFGYFHPAANIRCADEGERKSRGTSGLSIKRQKKLANLPRILPFIPSGNRRCNAAPNTFGARLGFQFGRKTDVPITGFFGPPWFCSRRRCLFKKFVIAFESGNCYESACCGWLSIGKRRAMPSLLRHE